VQSRRLRTALGALGAALVVVASLPPIADPAEEKLFSAHMAQHLLLGDIGPLLIALALGSRRRSLHPLVALVVWGASLALWHVPRLFDSALRNEGVHQLQHLCFFAAGVLLWSAILSDRWSVPWRLGAVVGVGLAGTALGNVFLWSGHVLYAPYAEAPRTWDLSPLADQRFGGAIMLAEGAAVTLAVFAWLVLRSFGEEPG
jgi:cytochrome c oxidase assembly factor CtaG